MNRSKFILMLVVVALFTAFAVPVHAEDVASAPAPDTRMGILSEGEPDAAPDTKMGILGESEPDAAVEPDTRVGKIST